ncbi:MAG: hypothetical protein GTN95_11270, partial [Gammaproteobacteria bacterium]|nr:hypothetical protein [Gammaproteobacteria bacterium]
TMTAADGDLYLAAVSYRGNVGVQGVSGLGLAWSEVATQCSGRNATGVSVWRALGTPSGDGAVTATLDSQAASAVLTVTRYSGVDAASLGNVVTANSHGPGGGCSGGTDSDSYSFDLQVTQDGAVVYGAAALRSRQHSPGSGY